MICVISSVLLLRANPWLSRIARFPQPPLPRIPAHYKNASPFPLSGGRLGWGWNVQYLSVDALSRGFKG